MKRIILALLLVLFFPLMVLPADVSLVWDPVIHPDLKGYKLYVSFISGAYTNNMSVDVGNVTAYTFAGLEEDKEHFFVATAYSVHGEESNYSNEVSLMRKVRGIRIQP